MRPLMWTCHISVLHGVVMDVVQVAMKIVIVADGMLPKPALPHTSGTLANARVRATLFPAASSEESARECRFDGGDTDGKVSVAVGKGEQ